MDTDDTVGSLQEGQRFTDGLCQIALIVLRDQVGNHFGVRLRLELDSIPSEDVLQRLKVLDDPVVGQRQISRSIGVGMGVDVVHLTVGRPSGVTDPQVSLEGARHVFGQIPDLPFLFDYLQPAVDYRTAGRFNNPEKTILTARPGAGRA